MTTIVYAHPWAGSFNHAILETVTKQLDFHEENYTVIDLYADGFNPTMTANDLRLYNKGKTADKNADRYRHILSNTTEIIFIFPIWWGMIPANLKGFFDKALLRGSAFNYDNKGQLIPALHIKRTVLITTSQGETDIYRPYIEDYFIPNVLNAVGMIGAQWYNCDRVSHGPEENRKNFLEYIQMVI